MTDESVLHEKEGRKKSFLSVLILSHSGEKCQIIEMAFKKKKLKPNLSKTLQVLATVAIVSEMNAIQLKLAAHFIPLVHLLISNHTACLLREIYVHRTREHRSTPSLSTFTDSWLQILFSSWLFKGATSCVI